MTFPNCHFPVTFLSLYSTFLSLSCHFPVTFLSLSCHFPVTFLSLSCHFPLLSCHCQGSAEGRCGPNCPRYTTNGCECAKSWVQEGHEEPGGVGAISINLLPFWNHLSSMQGIDTIDATLAIGCLKKEGHRGSCWVQLV